MDSDQTEQEHQAAATLAPIQVRILQSSGDLIEVKIAQLASEISAEGDISLQKQKAELLESYLRILEKIRSLSR